MRPDVYLIEIKAAGEQDGNTSYRRFPLDGPVLGRFWVTREFVNDVDERILTDVLGHKVLEVLKL